MDESNTVTSALLWNKLYYSDTTVTDAEATAFLAVHSNNVASTPSSFRVQSFEFIAVTEDIVNEANAAIRCNVKFMRATKTRSLRILGFIANAAQSPQNSMNEPKRFNRNWAQIQEARQVLTDRRRSWAEQQHLDVRGQAFR